MSIVNKDQLVRDIPQFSGALAIPGEDDGPVFKQPWEAKAFALVVQMHAKGLFTWKEWVVQLTEVIAEADKRESDDGSKYYYHWLAALERILSQKRVTTSGEISEREAVVVEEIHHTHEHQKHHHH